MAFKSVPGQIIPLMAGFCRVTELDAAGSPMYDKAVTTKREFVISTQSNKTSNFETLPNGNGQDKDFPVDNTWTLAVATNTYDRAFHSALDDSKDAVAPRAILHDTTIVPTAGASVAEYTFADEAMYPVASADEKYHFEIRDEHGNLLKETQGSPTTDDYKYENASHKLTLPEAYVNKPLSVVYYINGASGVGYEAPTILRNKQFMIEVGGEVQDPNTGEQARYYSCLTRATVSGDLPGVTTQKQITNTITYNFKSAPVPVGVVPFYESFTPIKTAKV